jgi:hypothetical protein
MILLNLTTLYPVIATLADLHPRDEGTTLIHTIVSRNANPYSSSITLLSSYRLIYMIIEATTLFPA